MAVAVLYWSAVQPGSWEPSNICRLPRPGPGPSSNVPFDAPTRTRVTRAPWHTCVYGKSTGNHGLYMFLYVFTFQNAGVLMCPLNSFLLQIRRMATSPASTMVSLLQSILQQEWPTLDPDPPFTVKSGHISHSTTHSGKESQSFPPGAPAEENITHRAASGCPNGGPDAQPAIADIAWAHPLCFLWRCARFYTRDYQYLSDLTI